jgi:TonB family protein
MPPCSPHSPRVTVPMTFRTSLYLSVAVHMLIFGSAVAVAQLATGLFHPSRNAVTVELVSSGMKSGTGQGAPSTKRITALHTVEQPQEQLQVLPDAQAGRAVLANEQNTATGDIRPESSASVAASSGNAGGLQAQNGSTVSREWATLVAALERSKGYPRLARERGIEGVVRLRFRLTPVGDVEKVEILESSGHEILDTASIRAVYRDAPMPYVSGWVEIPMAYVLK